MLYTTLWRSNLNQCFATCAVHYAVKIRSDVHFVAFWLMLDQSSMIRMLSYHASLIQRYFLFNWRPPTLPCRLQHSTIGRLGLNHRVRDGNGCYPKAHRHQIFWFVPRAGLPSSYSASLRTHGGNPSYTSACLSHHKSELSSEPNLHLCTRSLITK